MNKLHKPIYVHEAEGRKREERFLLMTGVLLFTGLGVSAEFCGLGGRVMSAPETSLVSVICAAPPFPRSPCRSFKRALPVSRFQSEAALSGVLGHNQLTLPCRS